MKLFNKLNKYDIALLLLISSLFAGNMSGVLLLPRTISFLLLPFFLNSFGKSRIPQNARTLFLVWFLWGVISLLITPDFSEGVLQLILLLSNFILALEILIFAKHSSNTFYAIAIGWLISLTINNVVGIWEITTDNHLSVSKFGSEHEINIGGRAVLMHYANGFFSNYNAFVAFTCCALPFVYYLLVYAKNKFLRYVCFINLVISIYTIFMNASRGGVLSLLIISVFFLYSIFKVRNFSFRNILSFGLLLGFVIYFWDSLSSLVIGRQSNIASIEDEARYIIWDNCIKVYMNSYGLGTGIGGLAISMERVAGKGSVLVPHNAFLEILVQYGTIVFLVFLNFLRKLFLNIRKRSKSPSKILIYSSLLAMPFIFIINSVYLINPFFWAFIMSLLVFSDSSYLKYNVNQA